MEGAPGTVTVMSHLRVSQEVGPELPESETAVLLLKMEIAASQPRVDES